MPAKCGQLWSWNGWERLTSCCTPPKFSHWKDTASLTAWALYDRQQANIGTCYVVTRAYSIEQHNAGRAHGGLCHASSWVFFLSRAASLHGLWRSSICCCRHLSLLVQVNSWLCLTEVAAVSAVSRFSSTQEERIDAGRLLRRCRRRQPV